MIRYQKAHILGHPECPFWVQFGPPTVQDIFDEFPQHYNTNLRDGEIGVLVAKDWIELENDYAEDVERQNFQPIYRCVHAVLVKINRREREKAA